MPSASNYTNKIRFAASVKNTKAQLPGGVGNLTQGSIAGCGLDIQYTPIDYIELCKCLPPPKPILTVPIVPLNLEGMTVEDDRIEILTSITFQQSPTLIFKFLNGFDLNNINALAIPDIPFSNVINVKINGNTTVFQSNTSDGDCLGIFTSGVDESTNIQVDLVSPVTSLPNGFIINY